MRDLLGQNIAVAIIHAIEYSIKNRIFMLMLK